MGAWVLGAEIYRYLLRGQVHVVSILTMLAGG
jgi:hypothetical protein